MEIKTIKKSVIINAPKEQVWNVLFDNKTNLEWFAAFKEGSYAETDWQQGSKALFKDGEGNGIAGKIASAKPFDFLDIEFSGIITNGTEDFESAMAKAVKGSHETYELTGSNGTTQLNISSDMGDEWFDMMSEAWDKALEKIKALAEQQN